MTRKTRFIAKQELADHDNDQNDHADSCASSSTLSSLSNASFGQLLTAVSALSANPVKSILSPSRRPKSKSLLPGVFVLIERGEWKRVVERVKKHPKECQMWGTVKKNTNTNDGDSSIKKKSISVKCKALHHACHRLRSVHNQIKKTIDSPCTHIAISDEDNFGNTSCSTEMTNNLNIHPFNFQNNNTPKGVNAIKSSLILSSSKKERDIIIGDDPWIEACKAILEIIHANPDAASERESRHGCLPLHLACFAMCPTPTKIVKSRDVKIERIKNTGHDSDNLPSPNSIGRSRTSPRMMQQTSQLSKSKPNGFPVSNVGNHSDQQKKHKEISISNFQNWNQLQTTGENLSTPPLLKPLMRMKRSVSNCSLASCTDSFHSDHSSAPSLGGFSAMMEGEDIITGCSSLLSGDRSRNSNDKDSPFRNMEELERAMEDREEELRGEQEKRLEDENVLQQGCINNSCVDFSSMAEALIKQVSQCEHQKKELKAKPKGKIARPSPLSQKTPRNISSDTNITSASLFSNQSRTFQTSLAQRSLSIPTSEYLKTENYNSNTSLRDEYSVKVLNALLDAYPKGVRYDSEGGRLPLHTAVAGRATIRVIKILLRAYPDAARHRTKDGYLPLHLAAHWGVSGSHVAPSLLLAYPDASVGKNRWERTPLEEALVIAGENGRELQVELVKCLRRHPKYWTDFIDLSDDKIKNNLDFLLHRSLEPNVSKEFKEILPKSTCIDGDEFQVDKSNHDSPGTEQIKQIPFSEFDNGKEDDDNHKKGIISRMTPRKVFRKNSPYLEPVKIHQNGQEHHLEAFELTTIIKNQNWDALIERIQVNPRNVNVVLKTTVRGGYTSHITPIYLACEQNPPLEVVESLVDAYSKAFTERKIPGGQLPLHAICTWGAKSEVAKKILAVFPAGIKQHDDHGNLPLHCACFSGSTLTIIEMLLCQYPRSVNSRNAQGSTPGDIVRRLRHSNRREVLDYIERVSFELLKKKQKTKTQNLRRDSSPLIVVDIQNSIAFRGKEDSIIFKQRATMNNLPNHAVNVQADDERSSDMMWV